MKHFLICLICICMWPVCLLAQKTGEIEQPTPYDGQPIVYIAGYENTKKADEFNPIPFTFSGDVDIQTPFGQKTTAAFVPQTTDFKTIIKVLGNGDIVVEEYIQLMNTSKDSIFKRTWPRLSNASFALTETQKDGTPARLNFKQERDTWSVEDTTPMTPGVHNFKISYLLKNALIQKDGMAQLKLSLTGSDWPLPVERFSAVVLFPKKTTLTRQDMLFGKNELLLPEAVNVQTDAKGNVLYTLERPLPALADVTVDVEFDGTILQKPSLSDLIFEQMNHTLFWLCTLALVLYAGVTLLYLKHKKNGVVLKELNAYSFLTLHFIAQNKTDAHFLKQLATFYAWQKKRRPALTRLIKLKMRFPKIGQGIIKLCIWTHILRKYILTMGLMIALVIFQSVNVGMALSALSVTFLLILLIALLILIYIKGEKPFITRQIWAFERFISNENIGFGLSAPSLQALFVQLYPYSLALGHEKEWINSLKPYKINITPFTFLEQ